MATFIFIRIRVWNFPDRARYPVKRRKSKFFLREATVRLEFLGEVRDTLVWGQPPSAVRRSSTLGGPENGSDDLKPANKARGWCEQNPGEFHSPGQPRAAVPTSVVCAAIYRKRSAARTERLYSQTGATL